MPKNDNTFKNLYKPQSSEQVDKELILSMQTEAMKSQIEKIAQMHHINLNNSNLKF